VVRAVVEKPVERVEPQTNHHKQAGFHTEIVVETTQVVVVEQVVRVTLGRLLKVRKEKVARE
jgi:hypothetical protein